MVVDTKAKIVHLLRGISANDVETTRQAWRDLLSDGECSVQPVCEKLLTPAWRDKPVGPGQQYLGILLTLLHELSPDRFGSEVARLLSEPLHPVYRQTVEIMARQKGDKVFGTIADRVPVYISDDVDDPDLVFRYLYMWSQTRDLDILTVSRVDVIAKRPGVDFLGKYNILFDGIVLAWPNGTPNLSGKWLRKMGVEATFYHEVGHHAYQQTEGGQVLDQEEEAKAYEYTIFINARPVLFWILNITIGSFYRLARRFRNRKQGWISLMRGGSGPRCHPVRRTKCCLGRDAVPRRALNCSAPCQFRHIFG